MRRMQHYSFILVNTNHCAVPGFLGSPPNIDNANAFLMSSWPYMEGAILAKI